MFSNFHRIAFQRPGASADEPHVPAGRLLLLSPHLDDAALSCAALLDRAEPIDLITVFAGRPDPPRQGFWDRYCGFASSAQSQPIRVAEDEAAFAGSPHSVSRMQLIEAQYLGGEYPNVVRSRADALLIAEAVAEWCARADGGIVALPAGAGSRQHSRPQTRLRHRAGKGTGTLQHPDHLFVRDAALSVIDQIPSARPLLYEELPYGQDGEAADQEVASVARSREQEAVPLSLPVDRNIKAARISAYTSQVPFICSGGVRLDRPANLPSVERYWWLTPAKAQHQAGQRIP